MLKILEEVKERTESIIEKQGLMKYNEEDFKKNQIGFL